MQVPRRPTQAPPGSGYVPLGPRHVFGLSGVFGLSDVFRLSDVYGLHDVIRLYHGLQHLVQHPGEHQRLRR